jgi:YHS domain-containing protein/putative intracellular protease/amidase
VKRPRLLLNGTQPREQKDRRTMVSRRELLQGSAALGLLEAGSLAFPSGAVAGLSTAGSRNGKEESGSTARPLTPPAHGSIPVAFLVSEGAVMIDFAGPWEVFQDVVIAGRSDAPFRLYTVGETNALIHASGGMKITPDYTIDNAPAPRVIVIPAQSAASERVKQWIRRSAEKADVTMSVCTGAFVLASTGLLSGKAATTNHGAYVDLEKRFPDIQVKRGARFVESGNLASAGGLSSGIDLALRVVERYFGRDVATKTAYQMEYQGQGWLNPDSNEVYAKLPKQTDGHPICPVCGMDGDLSLKTSYKGKTYYFCSEAHKQTFEESPERFING